MPWKGSRWRRWMSCSSRTWGTSCARRTFPLGTAGDLVVISVTEGDDMVRKHPKIFAQTDVVAVNKVDLAGFVGVDPMVLVDDYRRLNPQGKVVLTDARSGRGVDELLASLGL